MSSHPTRRLFLLSYDNGCDYEDHRCYPLFLVRTREQADRVVAEVAAWLETARAKVPPCPYQEATRREEEGQNALTEAEYDAMYEARKKHLSTRRPPYGITEMRGPLDEVTGEPNGHLTITPMDYRDLDAPQSQ